MRDALLVFAAQFIYVLLLGWQSLAVNHGRHAQAAFNSFLLGSLGFYMTGIVAAAKSEIGGLIWAAYVSSGPLAVVTSMVLFKRWGKKKCESP